MNTVGVGWGRARQNSGDFPPVFLNFDNIGDVYGANAEDDLSTGNRPKGD